MPHAAFRRERSFERVFYKKPAFNGQGFVYCYEIRWADGTSRVVTNVNPRLAQLAGVV